MTDVYSPEKRSQVMRAAKSRDAKSTELKLIAIFKENKIIGWRRTYPLFGKPDFVFPKKRIALFVDGCFWHGHDCRNLRPSEHKEYWDRKRERNQARDRLVSQTLTDKNWTVVRIWECELKAKSRQALLEKLKLLVDER